MWRKNLRNVGYLIPGPAKRDTVSSRRRPTDREVPKIILALAGPDNGHGQPLSGLG
jgi:hypothetical protein